MSAIDMERISNIVATRSQRSRSFVADAPLDSVTSARLSASTCTAETAGADRRKSRLLSLSDFLQPGCKKEKSQAELEVIANPQAIIGADGKRLTNVLVKVKPPEISKARVNADIVCVLDISGSMSAEARITGASGTESHGLSLLDVAKHAVRTIINTLSEDDRFSLVAFNHEANVVVKPRTMDEAGKKDAETQLNALRPGGGTDIWLGLRAGLEELLRLEDDSTGQLGHIMLLTDGATTMRTTVMPRLIQYAQELEDGNEGHHLPCTLNTFGFGYAIDSALLCDIAEYGHGSYSFIPDAGFVGTIFVNTLSNILVTMGHRATLALVPAEGVAIEQVMGNFNVADKYMKKKSTREGAKHVELGTLQFGQTRDVVVQLSLPVGREADGCLQVSLDYAEPAESAEVPKMDIVKITKAKVADATGAGVLEIERHWCRSRFAEALFNAVATQPDRGLVRCDVNLKEAQGILLEAQQQITGSAACDEDSVKALLEDIQGQSFEALSRAEYYQKWGIHYLPSLAFAHRMQQCNNFKDPGVQLYGGEMFEDLRDTADEMFNNLPPPEPSIRSINHASSTSTAQPISMASYNDRYAGCIAGDSLVELVHAAQVQEQPLRSSVRLEDLRKGDSVLAEGGAVAEVVCVVRTFTDGYAPLVELPGGARLTPYHPVLDAAGSWCFPADLGKVEVQQCSTLCSIILRRSSAIAVGGVPCIALGHGIEEGAAKHPYFGSHRAVEDIERMEGFKDGIVDLPPGCHVRDPSTGFVCGVRVDMGLDD